jgi:hypothetical protein
MGHCAASVIANWVGQFAKARLHANRVLKRYDAYIGSILDFLSSPVPEPSNCPFASRLGDELGANAATYHVDGGTSFPVGARVPKP